MCKLITSKTHRYLSVRLQPSDYTLKKFRKNDSNARQKMWDYGKLQVDFRNDLYEYVTGKKVKDTYSEYMFFREECTEEEIHELTGIRLCRAEHYLVLCIPKNQDTEKHMESIPKLTELKTKELKKTNGSYSEIKKGTYWRDKSKKCKEEFYEEFPEMKK